MKQPFLFETSAGGIVVRNATHGQEWLVIQHAGKKHWGFPKGHIADNIKDESMLDAALREVQEEGGIEAKVLFETPYQIKYFFKRGVVLHKKRVAFYLMEYISGDPADHDHEIEEAKFVSTAEVAEILTFASEKKAFQWALKMYKNVEKK
ncbi:MAG: NUDIX hydrolase [Weeksellaceae bacterium]